MERDHEPKGSCDITSLLSKDESRDEEQNIRDYDTRLYGRKPWYKRHRNALVFHTSMILVYMILAPFIWNRFLNTCQGFRPVEELVYCIVNSMILTINNSLLNSCGEIHSPREWICPISNPGPNGWAARHPSKPIRGSRAHSGD